MPLNPKQQRFADEYLIDLNATQAAIRAGYSPHSAHVQGSQLLAVPSIRAEVDARSRAMVEKVAGSAEWIVEQTVRVVKLALDSDPPDLRAATPALALLAKRHPEFRERHDIQAMIGVVVERRTPALDDDVIVDVTVTPALDEG